MRCSAVLLLLIPAVAAAQIRPGGFGRGRGPGKLAREEGITAPRQVNAVNLLILHRQDLSLSDSQFVRIIAIKRVVDSTNAPFMRKVDSVERLFKSVPIFHEPSRAHRDSVAEGRAVVQEAVASMRENLDAARDKAYTLLSSTQLAKAQDFEAKEQKEIDDEEKRGRGGRL